MANLFTKQVTPKTTRLVSFIALLFFIPLLVQAVYQTAILISRATGKPASIVVDTKVTLEPLTTDFYHAFAQGGEEAGDMLAPVLSEIKALRPRLIGLDHIYDHYDVVTRSGSQLNYDFSKLDIAVNSILATGAKPVLALSYMPSVIAKDGVIINPPNDWAEWTAVVARTIEHYSGKNEKNLSGVYYEVWNEPDLEIFGKWGLSGDKNYLTLYQYAATGAKLAQNVNQFFLGGPATTGLYKNWILALVTSGQRLDFISWHSYLSDPKRFDTDQRNVITWLLPYPGYTLLPKLITEFGFTGSKSTGYGSTYASAFTAAVIRQIISGRPTYLFSFQLKDGPGQQKGDGWGLLSHEDNGKKAKPRYYVYNFLDQMAGTRLALSGEGTWVTSFATQKDNVIRVLLVNFDGGGSHIETTPVTLNNLDNGLYTVRTNYLFGQDVNSTVQVTDTIFSTKIYLPAQSVAILELTKQ